MSLLITAIIAGLPRRVNIDMMLRKVKVMYNQPKYWLLDEEGNPYPSNVFDDVANEQLNDIKKRRVAITERDFSEHAIQVSTVFLIIDHNFFREGPPILFETMIFVDDSGVFTQRYATREEAQAGHDETVIQVDELLARVSEADVAKIGTMLKMLTE